MLNKEEIIYNSMSLVDTWLDGVNDINGIWVEMCGGECKNIYPCTRGDCGEVVGNLLYDNNGKYSLLNLYVKSEGVEKIVGSIDIV